MSWFAELRSAALVGTGRLPAPVPPVELTVRPPAGSSGEQLLLDQAALADVVMRASRVHATTSTADLPEAAPPDTAPVANGAAVQLLDLLLAQSPLYAEARIQLVGDWLQLSQAAGCRVPHRLLPALLALGAAEPRVGKQLDPAIGNRGRWLRGLSGNAANNDAAEQNTDAATAPWTTLEGSKAAEAFERLRQQDPAAAREQLGRHWAALNARQRAQHLAVLDTKLHNDDEELLESALDDKAKTVREVAARLLDKLPDSARASRMAARLSPLLQRKGLLRKRLEIDLPEDPDEAGLRDGLAPNPKSGEPDRLLRLDAISRGAPLDVWTTATGLSKEAVLALLEGEPRIIGVITTNAARRRDLDWVRALLGIRLHAELLNALPAKERESTMVRHLRDGSEPPASLARHLWDLPTPWGMPLAEAVLDLIPGDKGAALAQMLSTTLPTALPPEAAARCQQLLDQSNDKVRRRVLGDAVKYQSFRQSLTEAFL